MPDDPTVETEIARALEAYASLTELGEEVEDEWTYVTDLADAWQSRLTACAEARGAEAIDGPTMVAFDRAIDEIGRIEDPHRAIDWLSTFPQVVLVALRESS